jgi:two-component sensor histidine kinase
MSRCSTQLISTSITKDGIWMPTGNPTAIAAATPDPLAAGGPIDWHATAEGVGVAFAAAWSALTGQNDAECADGGWLACVHPEDHAALLAGWQRAQATRLFSADLRVRTAGTGDYRWLRMQGVPANDDTTGWRGTAIDVSDLHQRLIGEQRLRAALHHRIRNTLAVIRSIARRTAENSDTVEDYRSHFDGRLAAFARTQSHIMRAGDQGVDLEGLLADALLAHQVGGRVAYSGPEVGLPPRLADQLGIAFHELTDNAVQHGALSRDDGRLDVRWWTAGAAGGRQLHIDWHEELPDGGVVAPDGEGFGLELLTRSLHYEVDAEVTLDFADHGMRCAIVLPLDGG